MISEGVDWALITGEGAVDWALSVEGVDLGGGEIFGGGLLKWPRFFGGRLGFVEMAGVLGGWAFNLLKWPRGEEGFSAEDAEYTDREGEGFCRQEKARDGLVM